MPGARPRPAAPSQRLALPLALPRRAPAAYGPSSEQYAWLARDLAAVDRARTPWVIAVFHAPWYNSNYAHQVRPLAFGCTHPRLRPRAARIAAA